jgi:UDP-N-acetylglucosamine--N-acetylmuramyl-(pentapeptide) pyrophosphoryl-undecaprenol N-acetylglucosamine transferase
VNFAIACGGTGGHLFPGLAVAEALQSKGHKVLLLVSEKEVDATAVAGRIEFSVEKIPAIGLPDWHSPQVVSFPGKFLQSIARCVSLFRKFRPAAVLGMGGFTSTSPILAGRTRGLPALLHESNAIPGKANRLNARFCDRVLLGFAECARHFPNVSVEVTGTPIRSSLRHPVDREDALHALRLKPGLQTILVMGGSQGAHGINQAVMALLPSFLAKAVQFVHLTGDQDQNVVREAYWEEGLPAYVAPFHHRMEELYTVADLAIARAGAASLTEISYFGIPGILIPYPFAAENHQLRNAKIFAAEGAAEIVEESQINTGKLVSTIDGILSKPDRRKLMSERMRALAPTESASRIAEIVERAAG